MDFNLSPSQLTARTTAQTFGREVPPDADAATLIRQASGHGLLDAAHDRLATAVIVETVFSDLIDGAFETMEPADRTCFDYSVVERPAWTAIRAIAADALREFGWENTVVAPFKKVEPGVSRRPPAEA